MRKIILLISLLCLTGCSREPNYKIIKEGEVSQVDYQQGNFSENAKTIIGFKDGSFQVLSGSYSIPSTKIKILKQDRADNCCSVIWDCYKLEASK